MSDAVAVREKESSVAIKSRFGYQSAKLRVVTSIGLCATGGAGLLSALADVVRTAQVSPITDVSASALNHLRYTVFMPSLPGVVGDGIGMAAISGAVVGVGIVHALRGWKSFTLPSATTLAAGGAALVSLALGGISYGSSTGGDPAVSIEENWTQQNFSISRELPNPVQDYNTGAARNEWYPAVFSISKSTDEGLASNTSDTAAAERYYLVSPVLNANGDQVGDDVKQVDKATAQKAQDLYTKHSGSSSSRR